ncbi:hypothetical protein F5Y05DRAFT_381212 [Hypoxylon sp. FL0543]|nr:hypothetical protein F5Y05DRAFT_381212 [Hypoxylon sp. FL0543]
MASANKIDVALLADEDIPTCFQIVSKSFGHDAAFVDIYFPNHDTPSGQAQGSQRLAAWKRRSENSTFLKAVLRAGPGDQERVIGLAIWTYMKEAPPADLAKFEDVEEVWPDKGDREYMTRLWREYVVPRSKAINDSQGKGAYVLELLAVHPDYQRLGAGTALVKWGTKAADEKGVAAVVEATQIGRHLYERCGLRTEIEEMVFDVGEEFVGRRKLQLTFLKWEPKS